MQNITIESIIYEGKPFACVAAGLYTLSLHQLGPLAKVAGLILLGCAGTILYMRARHRGMIH